jgi:hypothetical protein
MGGSIMASIINASTAGAGGVITTADASGVLELQSGSTTVATLRASGVNAGIQVAANAAPAFSAYRNGSQTGISSAVDTKIQINAENFDTNNNFDSTTNYRFTPTVAGYYQVNGIVAASGVNLSYLIARIFKNGVNIASGTYDNGDAADKASIVSIVVYLNGSTDYIELYVLGIVGSGAITAAGSSPVQTTFSAAMVRSA